MYYMYYEVVNMFIENFLGKVHTIELQVKDTHPLVVWVFLRVFS